MDRQTFEGIKQRHGGYASWAIWADPTTRRPKSNIGDLTVLDPDQNADLLGTIRRDVVMVGLNLSRPCAEPFRNFHDTNRNAQDFKIRYAFSGTPYYGAYMTDIVKGVVVVESTDLMRHLAAHPALVGENVQALAAEIDDLGCAAPTVIAFGNDAFGLAARYLAPSRYSRLVGVTHYAHFIAKEAYREQVLAQLAG
jgi:hypothetical protein